MTTAADVRNASHALAQVSALLRRATPPTAKEWEYLLSQFTADELLEVSNWLIEAAKKMEARERAA